MNYKWFFKIGFFLIFIILLSCKGRNETPAAIVKAPAIYPGIYSKIEHVNFYIENSGSMFGYVNGPTGFVNAVNDLAQFSNLVETETSFSYFLINGKKDFQNIEDSLSIISLGNDPANLKSNLTSNGFRVGSYRYSDLNNMFEIALKKAQKDSISMLISDGIYDVGGSANPTNALENEGITTRTKFINRLNRLEDNDIETLLIKLESDFNGYYHPANVLDPSGTSVKINQKRPYYIWIFGKSNLLNKYFPEERLQQLNGYIDLARFRKLSDQLIPYKGIGYNNLGFRLDFRNTNTFKLYRNVTDTSHFNFAVDFSALELSKSYLTTPDNYSCSGSYLVKDIYEIGEYPPSNLKPYLSKLPFNATHIITVSSKTKQPETGELIINLNYKLPNWIDEASADNDFPFDGSTTTTFGYNKLVGGIAGAYKEKSNTDYLAHFKIEIKK